MILINSNKNGHQKHLELMIFLLSCADRFPSIHEQPG